MSGSIGGSRINRHEVAPTHKDYINNILSSYPGYIKSDITGSYNAGIKKDHGDIDLIVYIKGDDLKQIKKDFKSYLNGLNLPIFETGTNKGKKVQLYGSIVTCGYPIKGRESKYVQIDNIIVNSESSYNFQKKFLDMDAAKQAFVMGLTKIMFQYTDEFMLNNLGLNCYTMPGLKYGQEYEFTLSQKGLSLRIVTLSEDKKEISHEEIWRSDDWNDLLYILSAFDLDLSYKELVEQSYNYLMDSERNKKRVIGVMKSIIHVGRGEIGTPKGEGKINAIKYIENKLK